MRAEKIKTRDFISIFFRTFLLQTVWNYKGMISAGICFALVPVAKRVSATRKEIAGILKRHLGFFNAHPYFASFAIGALARLEEDLAINKTGDTAQIEKFKNALIGPLGAVGDSYFWAIVKPASILVGSAGVLLFSRLEYRLASALLMLILYNIPHLYIRITGLWKGYQNGYNTYKLLKKENYAKVKSAYQIMGALTLGIIISQILYTNGNQDFRGGLVFILAATGTAFLRHKGVHIQLSVLFSMGLAVVIGII